jgi:hypothetical protein
MAGSMNAESFKMSFELCRVPIYRPAINLAFIKSGFWRFDQQNQEYKNTLLSDGKQPPKGLMPAISTDCVFIRNLMLDFGERNSDFEANSKKAYGGSAVSFGPFYLGGRHESASRDRSLDASWNRQGVSIRGLQLIGFLCHTLDKCPDPNPKVTSWI